MNRIMLCLLAVLLSAAALTACGTDKDAFAGNGQAGSGSVVDGSADPDGDGSLEGNAPDTAIPGGSGVTDGETPGDVLTDGESAGSGLTGGDAAGSTAAGARAGTRDGSGAVIRGATYEQMVRNGFVRDADGDLRDGENTVTPGTVY